MTPHEEAELAALRKAAEARPSDGALWARYVRRLAEAGLKSRARKAARAAKLSGPERKRLMAAAEGKAAPLAEVAAALRSGNADAAWSIGETLLKSVPDDPALLNLMGVAALMRSDPVAAETVLARAHRIEPRSTDIAANLALALTRQGRAGQAATLLEPFASVRDAPLAVLTNLASAYLRADRPEDALSVSQRALQKNPMDEDVLGNHADALLRLGRVGEARDVLAAREGRAGFGLPDLWAEALFRTDGKEAAESYLRDLGAQSPDVALRLAERLAEIGLVEDAARFAREAAKARPDAAAFRLVSLLDTWTEGDPLLPVLQRVAKDDNRGAASVGRANLALAKAYLDFGNWDAGFAAMERGNRALRHLVDYDVADDLAEMARIAQTWSAEVVGEMALEGGPKPVFIVGLPRTGSTLAETILSRHPEVTALGETPRLYAAAWGSRNADEIAALRSEGEALLPDGVATDKLLANFLNVGSLAAAFPNARFIEVARDYPAAALSIFQAELQPTAHPYAMDLPELARYIVAYDALMRHWHEALPDRVHRIRYEDLVSDPASIVPRLVAAAGLEMHTACLDDAPPDRRISTLSVVQSRQGISTGSVARWRRFETGLRPLLDHLEKHGLMPPDGT